jgi:hypothetical protein
MDDVTVLCITGWCRNGSTIIGNVLGEIPGFFHAGELHFLWRNGAGKGANNLCGCGQPLTECQLWSRILVTGLPSGVVLRDFADTVMARQRACVRTRHTWRVLRQGPSTQDIRAHADLMSRTYRSIAERTGARCVVDTTKIPGEAALLPYLEGVTPYFVHLVRHPAAVANSWREPKDYVWAMSASRSTAYWYGFNLATRAITRRYPGRSMLLRYEDFIASPAVTIDALLRLVGADAGPGGNPVRGRAVELHTNHTVTGNPDRFRTGPTVIRDTDDSWARELSTPARLAALTMSWPLSWRYGYRRRPAARTANEGDRVGSGA